MENALSASEYIPSSNIDDFEKNDGVILSFLSDKVLLTNIEDQIDKPILSEKPINYLNTFNERYELITNKHYDDLEIINSVKYIRLNLLMRTINGICDKFSLTTDIDMETTPNVDIINMANSLYVVFVVNFKDNFIEAISNYILLNADHYYDVYKDKLPKKDLSRSKKTRSDKVILLMTMIYEIVNEFTQNSDNDTLLELMLNVDPDEYHHDFLIKYYDRGDLSPSIDFAMNFLACLKDESFKMDVVNEIKYIISKSSL